MNRKEFFEEIQCAVNNEDLPKIQLAYWLAKSAHRGQNRENGERYFEHCRRVACSYVEYMSKSDYARGFMWRYFPDTWRYDSAVIIALLHDCVEDCFIPNGLLETMFGSDITNGIDKLSKVKPIYDAQTGRVIKKMRLGDSRYFRIISKSELMIRFIKLTDRLDNLRSMREVWPKERQERYILETEKYILPIAKATDEKLFEALKTEIEKSKRKSAKNGNA